VRQKPFSERLRTAGSLVVMMEMRSCGMGVTLSNPQL
jgi:hypothetical protein